MDFAHILPVTWKDELKSTCNLGSVRVRYPTYIFFQCETKKDLTKPKNQKAYFRKAKLWFDATKSDESLVSLTIVGFGLVILVGRRYVLTNQKAVNEKMSTEL